MSATGIFALFQQNPFRAFQYLGLINILEQVLMIPVFFAFFVSHRQSFRNVSALFSVFAAWHSYGGWGAESTSKRFVAESDVGKSRS